MSGFCGKCGKAINDNSKICAECLTSSEGKGLFAQNNQYEEIPLIQDNVNRSALKKEIYCARLKFISTCVCVIALIVCIILVPVSLFKNSGVNNAENTDSAVKASANMSALKPVITAEQAYEEKLKQFREVLLAENEFELAKPIEMSDRFFENKEESFGYAFTDLNNDSIDELVIGNLNNEIYNIYTFSDNQLKSLKSCNQDELLYISDNNTIIKKNGNKSYEIFKLDEKGELTLIDTLTPISESDIRVNSSGETTTEQDFINNSISKSKEMEMIAF